MKLVIFEDETYQQLYPLSLTRAVFELKCGMTSLAEKIMRAFPGSEVCYFTRDYLVPTFKNRHPSHPVNEIHRLRGADVLLINGRCLFIDPPNDVLRDEGWAGEKNHVICAKLRRETLEKFRGDHLGELLGYVQSKTKKVQFDCILISHPWDLVHHNSEAILADFKSMNKRGIQGSFAKEAAVDGSQDQIYISRGAQVQPFVYIDATTGPVCIDEGAHIHSFTRIEGPCYIGKNSVVAGAKVRQGCSIGPVCRIGGEVEESIFHGFSNKVHEGFIGHSYIGEWVNLGALTTNSDLKNDYSTISVIMNGRPIDTGNIKVGSFIGDHTKTSIGTYMNTGAHIGALCIIVSSGGVLPKFLPSGSWFINNSVTRGFGLKKMLQTVQTVMERRKVPYTLEDAELLKHVYEITKPDRDALIER